MNALWDTLHVSKGVPDERGVIEQHVVSVSGAMMDPRIHQYISRKVLLCAVNLNAE